jgi:thiol-disulfide isomerase/thioredoxin
MLPNISIGPLTFPTAGLILLVGIWLALTFIERSARSLRLNAELIYSLSVVILASGFVGARLLFVVLHWSAFQNDLLGIIWPITSGYEIVGGLIVGVLTGFFYGRYRELPWLSTLDAVAPGIVVGLAAVSLADFLGGSGYGTVTSLPWAIDVFGIRRHPVQIYELHFWATWCPPCRAEMPHFQDASVKYDGRVAVIGVDQGESLSLVSDFAAGFGISYPLLLDVDSRINQQYGVTSLPTTLFIDSHGIIRETFSGIINAAVLQDRIERLLAEG